MLTESSKSRIAAAGKGKWVELAGCMLRARRTEERLIRLYHQGKIYGGVYTGVGQEAMGASAAAASAPQDLFAPCIRDITVHVGRGESLLNIFRQWLARATGPTRGRDGNVHYGNLKNGVYTMISHLGAMLPVVVGATMARRRQGVDAVGVAFIGDGGTSTGDFHEALNFAAVYAAPVIFLVENNHYAYSTPTSSQYKCDSLVLRAPGYGVDGHRADGNDAMSLYLIIKEIMDDIRRRPRAVLLECDTLRMRGHGEHDDFSYVPRELLDAYAARDPLKVIQRRLQEEGVVAADEWAELDRACLAEVDAAYNQALVEPAPDPVTLLKGVYHDD